MVYIYVLKLQKEKYYIGRTNNPYFRLNSHFKSNASKWTKKYKPLKIIEIIKNCDYYDEDKITMKYMDKYGINNVRGGSFVKVKLKKNELDVLVQMSNGVNDKCFVCGEKGHFSNNCTHNEYYNNKEYNTWCCVYCDKGFVSPKECKAHENECVSHENIYCNRKYEKETINDYVYYTSDDDDYNDGDNCCFRCGRKKRHYVSNCFASIKKKNNYGNCCFRCGRKGHYVSNCFASKHINGYYLK